MKILQVGSYLPPDLVGGAEFTAQCFAQTFAGAGHTVVDLRWAMAAKPGLTGTVGPHAAGGWEARTWRPMPPLDTGTQPRKMLFYALEWITPIPRAQLSEMMNREGIDLVVVHSFRGLGYDMLGKLADCGRPIITVLHDFALVCLNKGMARKGVLCETPCGTCQKVARRNRSALGRASRVALLSPSQFMLDRVGTFLDLPGAVKRHIPNPNRYQFSPRVREGSATLTWGSFGRIEPDKGFTPQLFAMADRLHEVCQARWIVAGKGSMDGELRRFAESRPWVDYRGQLPEAKMREAFDAIDVLAMPSLWPENFPGILVQALGNGVPVAGFAIGGIPEIIEHEATGLIVPFADFNRLGDAILALDKDRALLNRLSAAALQAADRYAPDTLDRRLLALVDELMLGHTVS